MPPRKGLNPGAGVSQSVVKYCGTCKSDTKHYNKSGKCRTCSQNRAITMKECAIHGLVKHHGSNCRSCQNEAMVTMLQCSTHGTTKHQGDTCCKCALSTDRFSVDWCEMCDIKTTHQMGTCMACNRGGFAVGHYKEKKTCVWCALEGCEINFVPQSGAQMVCKASHRTACVDCSSEVILTSDVHPKGAALKDLAIAVRCQDCREKKSRESYSASAQTRVYSEIECVLCKRTFSPKTNTQVLCENQHRYPCSTSSCSREVIIGGGAPQSSKNGFLRNGTLLEAVNEQRLQCRQCSRRNSAPERAFLDAIGLDGALLSGVGHIDGLDTKKKFAFEYDGSYWHGKSVDFEKDAKKTLLMLDRGYKVVRVRENKLTHLPITHPSLHQFSFTYTTPFDKSSVEQLAAHIKELYND